LDELQHIIKAVGIIELARPASIVSAARCVSELDEGARGQDLRRGGIEKLLAL
jgi:hypothetical protein